MARFEDLSETGQAARHVEKMGYVTHCGIASSFRTSLTWYDVQQTAIYLSVLDNLRKWTLADLFYWCWTQEGDHNEKLVRCSMVLDMAHCEGMKMAELLSYLKASRLWDWERRQADDILSFNHHVTVADMPQDRREYYLKLAKNSNWSVHRLKREIDNDHQREFDR
jgi:hypothetical protein